MKKSENGAPDLPLKGIRVIDLSMWFAGPMATRLLADMGAEVIKVESTDHMDPWRGIADPERAWARYPKRPKTDRPYECSPGFNLQNRNKLGITLNLRTDAGKEILKKLVKISDVLLENYSVRVMPKLGLAYPVLKEINPALIMMSMPALGNTGSDKDFVAFGQTIDCISGMAYLTGYRGEEPMLQSGLAYGDPLSGMNAAFAVISALLRRRRTGEGLHIELSQVEGLIAFNADSILDFTMNGRSRTRTGNRDRVLAPQGCYRCKGKDRWITISIATDEMWQRFCQVLNRPAWADDERFMRVQCRREHHDELDEEITSWTMQHEDYEAMHILQASGIPAGPVLDARDLISEHHLNARNFFETTRHPVAGEHSEIAPFAHFSRTPVHIRTPSPCLGQHNEYVFRELLGISREEIVHLEETGIIGTAAATKQQGGM